VLKYSNRKRKHWVHPFFRDNLNSGVYIISIELSLKARYVLPFGCRPKSSKSSGRSVPQPLDRLYADQVAEMKFMRKTASLTLWDHKRNKEIILKEWILTESQTTFRTTDHMEKEA
jgi:hypothetical protein